MGIPGGTNFVDHIKSQIQKPDLILLMLSPNYMESMFCLCELGAGWAMSHDMIPIIGSAARLFGSRSRAYGHSGLQD